MEGWAPGREAMGSDGLGWRAELVREGVGEVCVGGSRVGERGVCVCVWGALKNRSSS